MSTDRPDGSEQRETRKAILDRLLSLFRSSGNRWLQAGTELVAALRFDPLDMTVTRKNALWRLKLHARDALATDESLRQAFDSQRFARHGEFKSTEELRVFLSGIEDLDLKDK
jgi:hypothetical protein